MNLPVYKKKGFLFLLFISLATHFNGLGQNINRTPESGFFENVRFGGSLGMNFSNDAFSAFLAPRAVYDFNQLTSIGTGLAGSYTNANNFSAHSISGSVLGLLRPIQNIQLSAEFEENYVSRNWELEGANRKESYWYPALFLGLGYTTGPVTAGVRYDVLYDEQKSIYGSALMPFISLYF